MEVGGRQWRVGEELLGRIKRWLNSLMGGGMASRKENVGCVGNWV